MGIGMGSQSQPEDQFGRQARLTSIAALMPMLLLHMHEGLHFIGSTCVVCLFACKLLKVAALSGTATGCLIAILQ